MFKDYSIYINKYYILLQEKKIKQVFFFYNKFQFKEFTLKVILRIYISIIKVNLLII